MSIKYRFISDGGHGWLEVPLEELNALGIAGDITRYSYLGLPEDRAHGGSTVVYLEEDCDAGIFAQVKADAGHMSVTEWFRDHTTFQRIAGDCFIRKLPRFHAPMALPASMVWEKGNGSMGVLLSLCALGVLYLMVVLLLVDFS